MPIACATKAYRAYGNHLDAWKCREPEMLVVGPAGTGKSRLLLELMQFRAMKYSGSRSLMVRKTRNSLTQSILPIYENNVAPENAFWIQGASKASRSSYYLPNGSEIVLAGLDMPGRILSSEYDFIYVFEVTEPSGVEENDWEILISRLRSHAAPYTQICADANPSGPNHWIKLRCDLGKCKLINTIHTDNPSLSPEYLDRLSKLSGHRRARLYEGLWVAAEGLVYPGLLERFTEHSEPPKGCDYYGAIDFGFRDHFGVLLSCSYWAGDSQIIYLYKERKVKECPLAVHVEWIKANAHPDTIFFCDSENPEAIHELRKHGIAAYPSMKNILFGIESVNASIEGNRLFISNELVELKKEAEGYQYDGTKEKPVKKDDHLMDPLRYLVASMREKSLLALGDNQMVDVAITGGPSTGKTTLAATLPGTKRHTDDLANQGWSECSEMVSEWFDDNIGGIIEGVAIPRALRKWLLKHNSDDVKPCRQLIILRTPREELLPGQIAMAKGMDTVLNEIMPELIKRGVEIKEQ